MDTAKPLMLLDVDGPLNPFGLIDRRLEVTPKAPRRRGGVHLHQAPPAPGRFPRGRVAGAPERRARASAARPGPSRHARVGDHLGRGGLGQHAHRSAARAAGTARHHLAVGRASREARLAARGSWKTPHVLAWLDAHAPGTPWAWGDDELNRHDRALVREHYAQGGEQAWTPLLLRVEPHEGLRRSHFATLSHWAATATVR